MKTTAISSTIKIFAIGGVGEEWAKGSQIFALNLVSMRYTNYTYILEYIVSLANVALIDEVQGVPPEVHGFMGCFSLPVGVELFVLHQVDVKVDSGFETLLLHPVTAVAMKTDCVVAHTAQILNNLRSNQVSLPRVGQQADRLHVSRCEAALGQVLIQHISFLIINS